MPANIGLQRTAPCGLAAELGSFAGPSFALDAIEQRCRDGFESVDIGNITEGDTFPHKKGERQ
jgi:hypothetical protein